MSHSESQKRQKAEAMREAEHHAEHSTVDGSSEHRYLKSRQDYMAEMNEGTNPGVPKEMIEREYDKMPGGGYTHKRKGTYEE